MNYLDAGLETFRLQQEFGYVEGVSQEEALMAAIESAVSTYRRAFIVGVRDDLLQKAEELDTDDDNDLITDGPAALIWYAAGMDETLPFEQRLDNQ